MVGYCGGMIVVYVLVVNLVWVVFDCMGVRFDSDGFKGFIVGINVDR